MSKSVRRLGVALLAIAPPALTYVTWPAVRANTAVMIVLTIMYETLLLVVSFVSKVFAKLEERWISQLAETFDGWRVRRFSKFESRYRTFLRSIHHDVDLKGISTLGGLSLAVDQVFVDLTLAPTLMHKITNSLVQAGELGGPGRSEPHTYYGRRSLWSFLQDRSEFGARLAIIGPPGAGKTTLLKHVVQTLTDKAGVRRSTGFRFAFLIQLRDHGGAIHQNPRISLADVLRSDLMDTLQEPTEWFEKSLASGRCIVLLDGLDELGEISERASVAQWVSRQIAAYPLNSFVITSRPHGYRTNPLNEVTLLMVQPFTEEQIGRFLRSWYLATHKRNAGRLDVGVELRARTESADLLKRIQDNGALYDLAVNPLLLTMIAHVHLNHGALPGSRVALYREISQVFLGKRQEAKRISSLLTPDQKELVVRGLAYAMMWRRIRDVATDEAEEIIRPFIVRMGQGVEAADVLRDIERSSGLLVEREAGLYSFAHLTIQEYLAACHVKEQRLLDRILPLRAEEWWREVFLLYAAQSDASDIVRACLKDQPSVAELTLATDCLDTAKESLPELRSQLDALSKEGNLTSLVHVSRKLRQVVRIGEDLHVCREPASVLDFGTFLDSTGDERDRLMPYFWYEQVSVDQDAGEVPVVGVSHEAAVAYAKWVGTLSGDWNYRLPVAADPLSSASAVRQILSRNNIWTAEGVLVEGEDHFHDGKMMRVLCRSLADYVYWLYPGSVKSDLARGEISEETPVSSYGRGSSIRLLPLLYTIRELDKTPDVVPVRESMLVRRLSRWEDTALPAKLLQNLTERRASSPRSTTALLANLDEALDSLNKAFARQRPSEPVAEIAQLVAQALSVVKRVTSHDLHPAQLEELGSYLARRRPQPRAKVHEARAILLQEACALLVSAYYRLERHVAARRVAFDNFRLVQDLIAASIPAVLLRFAYYSRLEAPVDTIILVRDRHGPA